MLKIKLAPFGKKHARQWRIVVIEEHEKLTGNPTAVLGFVNTKLAVSQLKEEELTKWIKQGAEATPAVRKLLGL
jgi:ribosomal protein S16